MTKKEFIRKSLDFRMSILFSVTLVGVYFIFLAERVQFPTLLLFLAAVFVSGVYLSTVLRVIDILTTYKKRTGRLGRKLAIPFILYLPAVLGGGSFTVMGMLSGNRSLAIDLLSFSVAGLIGFVACTVILERWRYLDDLDELPGGQPPSEV